MSQSDIISSAQPVFDGEVTEDERPTTERTPEDAHCEKVPEAGTGVNDSGSVGVAQPNLSPVVRDIPSKRVVETSQLLTIGDSDDHPLDPMEYQIAQLGKAVERSCGLLQEKQDTFIANITSRITSVEKRLDEFVSSGTKRAREADKNLEAINSSLGKRVKILEKAMVNPKEYSLMSKKVDKIDAKIERFQKKITTKKNVK